METLARPRRRAGSPLAGADRKGREWRWTVMGASRGEAGILGEGIRQALLRDQTYGPALKAARIDGVVTDRELVIIDDVAGGAAERIAAAVRAGGHIALSGGSTPRKALRAAWPPWISTGPPPSCGSATSAAVPPDHEHSNYRMAKESLLDHVSPRAVHRIEGELGHRDAAAAYERSCGRGSATACPRST